MDPSEWNVHRFLYCPCGGAFLVRSPGPMSRMCAALVDAGHACYVPGTPAAAAATCAHCGAPLAMPPAESLDPERQRSWEWLDAYEQFELGLGPQPPFFA